MKVGSLNEKYLFLGSFLQPDKFKRLLEEKVRRKIQTNIQFVDNLPVGANGKYKIVEQRLPVSWIRNGSYM